MSESALKVKSRVGCKILGPRNLAMVNLKVFDVIRCSTFKPIQGGLYSVHEWWPF